MEKILKGLVVQETGEQAPYIHDLARLADLAKTDSDIKEIEFLKFVNGFNIKARYPDHKLKIYKKYDKTNTKEVFDKIGILYKKLCQKLK